MNRPPRGAREALTAAARSGRRRAFLIGSARALLAGLTGACLGPVASSVVLAWVPEGAAIWVAGASLVLGVCAGAVLGRWEWRRARPRRSVTEVAGMMAPRPELRDLVTTGIDLAAWGEEGARHRGASPELAEAQVQRAGDFVSELDPARALPLSAARPWGSAALAAALFLGGWIFWNPGGWTGAWVALLRGGVPEPVDVGNLEITYSPPAYTGLPERRYSGADGSVEGYPGTRIVLGGELSRRVDSGVWVGPGGQSVPLGLEGLRFSVSWILSRPGTYRLSLREGGDDVPVEFLPRSVTLVEDKRPEVAMLEPESDLEVSSDQEVEVSFRASDDFRVSRAELVLQGDEEVRLPISVRPGERVEGTVRFLPLAHPEVGEGVHLRVDAWDGDTVSGPKPGSSRSVYVSFLDKRRLLSEIEGLEERLLEALLTHLADHLELDGPGGSEDSLLREGGRGLLRLFGELAERVRLGAEQGALGALAVLRMEEGLRASVATWLEGTGDRSVLVAELERDILFLDKLLRSLRMEEALGLGDELAALQRSLFDDLQAGAKPEDLLARIEQIEQVLSQMARKLAEGAREMPDAFANADAVRDMPAGEIDQLLQELREALQRGDREAAETLAEKLLETLSRWMAAMEEAAQGASQGEMDPLLRELSEIQQEVTEISARQEEVLQETQEIGRLGSERAAEKLEAELEEFLQRQERRLRDIELAARRMEALTPRTRMREEPPGSGQAPHAPRSGTVLGVFESRRRVDAGTSEVRRALREDMGTARQDALNLGGAVEDFRDQVLESLEGEPVRREAALEYARAARENVQAILDDLDALGARRLEGLTTEERGELSQWGERQEHLGERTGTVAERLEELSTRTPLLDPGLPGKARGAQSEMGRARGELGRGDPYRATPPEARALEGLAEIAKGLEGVQEQMMEGAQGRGFQMLRRPGGRGTGREVDRSPVEIPKEAEARELRAFREEVLKAMRSGQYPRDYEEEVERYFERLIR